MMLNELYCEAKNTAHNILWSEHPHDRRIRVYRKSINRRARRKVAMLAERDTDMWCDNYGKLHAR